MKLRQRPEDFRVRERLEIPLVPEGAFGLYLLSKRGVTTSAVAGEVAQRLKLPARDVGLGGLKDAHAEARQHVTIPGPPRGALQGRGWRLEPVGRVASALQPGRTGGNLFDIVVRDLLRKEADAACDRAVGLRSVPNYFDSQRFGQLAGGGTFAARHLVAGKYEEAMKLLLASTYRGQEAREKEGRSSVAERWGDWKGLAQALPAGDARRVAEYLRDHPGAWSGALRRLSDGTRWLALAAYQSHLFNEILARHLRRHFPGGAEVEIRSGKLYFPHVPGEDTAAKWPLPQRRAAPPPPEALEDYGAVLAAEGIGMEDLRVAGARLDFPKGERAPWVAPEALTVSVPESDEMNRGRFKAAMSFGLPPGAYATVVVKRLTYDCGHTFRA